MYRTKMSSVLSNLAAPLMTAMVFSISAYASTGPYNPSGPVNSSGSALWTVLVYLTADSNLEYFGIEDMNEMEAGFRDNRGVNVVVQIDRIDAQHQSDPDDDDTSNEDWSTARRYVIRPDPNPDRTIRSYLAADIGEVNMSDPEVLQDFVEWGIDKFPARNTMLILWGHGEGWSTRNLDSEEDIKNIRNLYSGAKLARRPTPYRICPDDTTDDDMTTLELYSALEKIYQYRGDSPLQILGYDACLMQMFENVYQQRRFTEYVVASEELEPGAGWPYDTIISDLCDNPEMTPRELGRIITKNFDDYYKTHPASSGTFTTTLSSVRTSGIQELKEITDFFWYVLAEKLTRGQFIEVREQAQCIHHLENYGGSHMSLASYAKAARLSFPTDALIVATAQAVEAKLNDPDNSSFSPEVVAPATIRESWPVKTYIFADSSRENVVVPPVIHYQFNENEEFQWVEPPTADLPVFYHQTSSGQYGSGSFNYSPAFARNHYGYFYRMDLTASSDHSLCPEGQSYKVFEDTIEIIVAGTINVIKGKRTVETYYSTSGSYPNEPDVGSATGLSVFFPKFTPSDTYFWPYADLALAQDSYWFTVLKFIFDMSRYKREHSMEKFIADLEHYRTFQMKGWTDRVLDGEGRRLLLEAFLEKNDGDPSKIMKIADMHRVKGGLELLLGELSDVLGNSREVSDGRILSEMIVRSGLSGF